MPKTSRKAWVAPARVPTMPNARMESFYATMKKDLGLVALLTSRCSKQPLEQQLVSFVVNLNQSALAIFKLQGHLINALAFSGGGSQ